MSDIQIPQVKNVPIDSLMVDGKNPNVLSKKQKDALKKNFQRFGMIVPIITNKQGVIADGQHRLEIAKELSMKEVPVIQLDLEEVDRVMLRQILNKLRGEHDPEMDAEQYALIAGWGQTGLFEELSTIPARDINRAIEKMDPSDVDEDEFDTQAAVKEPKYVLAQGDMYQLGRHILMCGDSTNKNTFNILMGDKYADIIFTDPLYNLSFQGTNKGQFEEMSNDNLSQPEYATFARTILENLQDVSTPKTSYYVTMDYRQYPLWHNLLQQQGIPVLNCIVWDKVFAGMGSRYRYRHEFVIYAGDHAKTYWQGNTIQEDMFSLKRTTIHGQEHQLVDKAGITIPLQGSESYLRIKVEDGTPARVPRIDLPPQKDLLIATNQPEGTDIWEGFSMNYFSQRELESSKGIIHPTMKPLKLIATCLVNSSKVGDIVLDCFGGSGSTLIAAEQTGRCARVIEIDPVYASVILQRWEALTGQKATKIA